MVSLKFVNILFDIETVERNLEELRWSVEGRDHIYGSLL